MAVTQISRIQHRRGLQQDLPQLASAEIGWSIDTQQLYIGNGTLEEGAPMLGVTEILTEKSLGSIAEMLGTYTFIGDAAGVAAQTGPSLISPVARSFQQKLDDFVNVRDFGAKGDGITDDTSAINRAIQQIYKSDIVELDPRTRRTIYFPGGTYLITSEILVPPDVKLVGDGINNAIIKQIKGDKSVVILCDSGFHSGNNLGSGGANLPRLIEITGIQFFNSNVSRNTPLVQIRSATDVKIHHSLVKGDGTSVANLVSITGNVSNPTTNINFDQCQFRDGGNALSLGSSVYAVHVTGSSFYNITTAAVNLGGSQGFNSINNYYDIAGTAIVRPSNNYTCSIGDTFSTDNSTKSGLYLGGLQMTPTISQSVSSVTPTIISLVANTSATLNYQISNSSARRFGTFTYSTDGVSTMFTDNYTEAPLNIGANLYANADSIICSMNSGTAKLEFNYQFFNK